MATLTQNMIQELNTVDFLTTEQAAALAKQAFVDYSKRSNAAKAVNKAVWDMILAGGCPNSVFNAVEKLVAHYA
jgi:hypothetical protein